MSPRISSIALAAATVLIAGTASAQVSSTVQSRAQSPSPNGIPAGGPYVPPGTLFDNEQSNGITSLASQNSSGTLTARSADDFSLTATCASGEFAISQIRVQMVQADATPQAFAIDLFNDNGSGTAPTSGLTPLFSFPQTSQSVFGPFGTGTSIFEASFATPGLVLNANTTYWISGYGVDPALNGAAFNNFFATSAGASGTTANGVIIAPGAGVPDWTPADTVIGPPALAFSFAIDGECAASEADLGITKSVGTAGPVVVGSTVNFTLNVSNAGPADATGVVVTDTLPAGLSFVASTCGATAAGQVVTWNLGALANGASASCSLSTRVLNAAVLTNTASVTATNADSVTANNTASAVVTGVAPIAANSLSNWSWLALLVGTIAIGGVVMRRR